MKVIKPNLRGRFERNLDGMKQNDRSANVRYDVLDI